MEVNFIRVPEGETCSFTMTLEDGVIACQGTKDFVIGSFVALLAPDTHIHKLIVEHNTPEEVIAAWRVAVIDAGLTVPPVLQEGFEEKT